MCLRRRSVTYFTHDAKHRLVEADADDADGDGEFTCDGCDVAGAGLRYRCTHPGCAFKLHEACARRFPRLLKSVVHLQHRLKRYEEAGAVATADGDHAGGGGKCEVCGDDVKGACYGCAKCGGGIVVHPLCVHLPPVARGPAHGDGAHDAWLVRASDDAAATACAACGRGVGAWRYRCGTCRVDMHPRCLVPAADQCRAGDAPAASSKGKSCFLALVDNVMNCVAITGYQFYYRFQA